MAQEEQRAAIVQLHEMGFQIEKSQKGTLAAVTQNWERLPAEKATAKILQVQTLLNKAKGVRENIEVLAASSAEPRTAAPPRRVP
jgi:hypothetical protein